MKNKDNKKFKNKKFSFQKIKKLNLRMFLLSIEKPNILLLKIYI